MADEILSIEESTLNAIAQAIKNKGGTSAKLSFPDGMVAALQNIETEATVTPKITPQQVTLTPSNTSFAIDAGFHDGTGTVKIETETGSANPTSTEQTYYPSAGKFFSAFWVDGIGNATQIITGTVTLNNERNLVISGLSFTPIGIIVLHRPDPNVKRYDNQVLNAISVPNLNPNATGTNQDSGSYGYASLSFSFSSGSATVSSTSNGRFYDTYFYIVFGR